MPVVLLVMNLGKMLQRFTLLWGTPGLTIYTYSALPLLCTVFLTRAETISTIRYQTSGNSGQIHIQLLTEQTQDYNFNARWLT